MSDSDTHRAPLRARLRRGVFWTLLGSAGHRGLNAITSLIIARILGPAMFGRYAMVQTTVQLFTAFAGFRLGFTATKFIAELRDNDPARAGRILGLVIAATLTSCIALALMMFLLADWLARDQLASPDLATPIAIAALYLLFLMVTNVLQRALAGFEDFRTIALLGALRGITGLIICIPLTYLFGLHGAVISITITAGIASACALYAIYRQTTKHGIQVSYRWNDLARERSALTLFAAPAMLIGFVLVATAWQGRAMLLQFGEDGDYELGIFGATDQVRVAVLLLPTAIGSVALPIAAKSLGDQQLDQFGYTITLNVRLAQRLVLTTALLVIAVATPLSTILGPSYAGVADVIPATMLAAFVYAISQALGQLFVATARLYSSLGLHIVRAAIFLGCCTHLVPIYGAVGFAWTHVVADATLLAMQISFVRFRVPSMKSHCRNFLPPVAFGTLTLVAVLGLEHTLGRAYGATAAAIVFAVLAMPTIRSILRTRVLGS